MKREDIEMKSDQYAQEATPTYVNGDFDRNAIAQSFEDGANWRIDSVWNDITEKPKCSRAILVLYNAAGSVGVWYPDFEDVLKRFNKYHIMKWAYVDDLLPNKED